MTTTLDRGVETQDCKDIYVENELLEITINPSDRHQLFGTADRAFKVRNWLYGFLQEHKATFYHYLVMEVTTPNVFHEDSKMPRLHFHGMIVIKKDCKFTFICEMIYIFSKIASVAINPYRPNYWPSYITKQSFPMKVLCSNECLEKEHIKNLKTSSLANKEIVVKTVTPLPKAKRQRQRKSLGV